MNKSIIISSNNYIGLGFPDYFNLIIGSLICTLGFYQNNNIIIIGSMLLAPLVNPVYNLSYFIINYSVKDIIYCFLTTILWLLIIFNIALITSIIIKKSLNEKNYLHFYNKITDKDSYINKYIFMENKINTISFIIIGFLAGIIYIYNRYYMKREIIEIITGFLICISILPPMISSGILFSVGKYFNSFYAFVISLINITIMLVLFTFYTMVIYYKKYLIFFLFIKVILSNVLYQDD